MRNTQKLDFKVDYYLEFSRCLQAYILYKGRGSDAVKIDVLEGCGNHFTAQARAEDIVKKPVALV